MTNRKQEPASASESKSGKSRHIIFEKKLPVQHWIQYMLWNLGLMLLACGILTYFTLQLSYGNLNSAIRFGYFDNPWIPVFNLLITFTLCVFLFALTGRAWLGYLLTAIICFGITLANYYLISLRGNPLFFRDLPYLQAALSGSDEFKVSRLIIDAITISVLCSIALAFLSCWRPRLSFYYVIWFVISGALFVGSLWLTTLKPVNELTEYYKWIEPANSTELYVSRGVLYSFPQSVFDNSDMPSVYSDQ